MPVRNEHGIDLLVPGPVDTCGLAAQMPDPRPQDRIGE